MFSWNWGFGSRRRHSGPAARVIRLIIGITMVVFMGVHIGPAVSAAEGHGTRGFFVAQTRICGRNGCSWSGLFRLSDGQVTRRGVTFTGSHPGLHAGSVVPALDSGDFSSVFSRHGYDGWIFELAVEAFGIFLVGQTIWTWVRRRRAPYRMTAGSGNPGASPAGPGSASSPASL